jgi:hypothetical protein
MFVKLVPHVGLKFLSRRVGEVTTERPSIREYKYLAQVTLHFALFSDVFQGVRYVYVTFDDCTQHGHFTNVDLKHRLHQVPTAKT